MTKPVWRPETHCHVYCFQNSIPTFRLHHFNLINVLLECYRSTEQNLCKLHLTKCANETECVNVWSVQTGIKSLWRCCRHTEAVVQFQSSLRLVWPGWWVSWGSGGCCTEGCFPAVLWWSRLLQFGNGRAEGSGLMFQVVLNKKRMVYLFCTLSVELISEWQVKLNVLFHRMMSVMCVVPVFACCACCCCCCCLCCSSSIDRLLVFWTGWGVSPEPYGIIGLKMGMPGVMAPCNNKKKYGWSSGNKASKTNY